MSLRTELPTMQNRSGGDVDLAEDAGVRVGVLLQDDLDVVEVVGEPDVVTFRVWCTRSPFVISTSRWSLPRSASTAGTSGSRRTVSVSMPIPASSSWPITSAGTLPSDTVMAAWTIDSVNALTP